jgi:hypothetical protein
MAVNKTLYLKDEDAPIWDKAREFAGDKLSAHVVVYLKKFVTHKEATAQGFKRIVLTYREQGKLPRAKAFYGRWLIAPEDYWDAAAADPDPEHGPDYYSVAITAKNSIVVFNFKGNVQEAHRPYEWGNLFVFGSLEKAIECDAIPRELIVQAAERVGVEVEELDI